MNILLIGCGHMGSAMLSGWSHNQTVTTIDVVDPRADMTIDTDVIRIHKSLYDLADINAYDIVVMAVKPQIMADVCDDLSDVGYHKPLLSIAAGWNTAKIAAHFKTPPAIIRTMPNMPAAIGQGMLVSFANNNTDEATQRMAEQLLSPLGKHLWVQDEDLLHAVTALSGSGPAYIFALTKAMTTAGQAIGLPQEIAETLARQTVAGSAAYMIQSNRDAETLMNSIAVAGGTTEAAINILNNQDILNRLFTEAITAARDKSRDLGK